MHEQNKDYKPIPVVSTFPIIMKSFNLKFRCATRIRQLHYTFGRRSMDYI